MEKKKRNRKINAPVAEIRQLYQDGLSTRQIEARTGWSAGYVHKLVRDISRSRQDAAILRSPPTSTHWRSSRAAARKSIERLLGRKLRRDEHVHHINHDYTDNRIENLEVLDSSVHAYHHHPKNPVPRHLRTERIAYMKNYDRRTEEAVCPNCKTTFMKDRYAPEGSCCSHSCASTLVWKKKRAS